ncbi:MAG TPA: hypothetical protein VMD25_02915 [Acidobacteriaceae bacterium]|nr:hypothetical protein [Acidobacteriaceae bacterium]
MCLIQESHANTRKLVRGCSITAILLLVLSFLGSLFHVRSGTAADVFDFAGGLLVGIALVFGTTLLGVLVRRRRPS